MEKVLMQAEQLAEAILESEEYIKMRLAEQAAMKDEKAGQLVSDYSEKRGKVETILSDNNMDHQALAQAGEELESAEKAIGEYTLLSDMRKAREDFNKMMEQVNKLIKFVVTGENEDEAEGGCTGSCEGCGGCHH